MFNSQTVVENLSMCGFLTAQPWIPNLDVAQGSTVLTCIKIARVSVHSSPSSSSWLPGAPHAKTLETKCSQGARPGSTVCPDRGAEQRQRSEPGGGSSRLRLTHSAVAGSAHLRSGPMTPNFGTIYENFPTAMSLYFLGSSNSTLCRADSLGGLRLRPTSTWTQPWGHINLPNGWSALSL